MWGTNVYGGIETGVLGNKTKNANQYKARLVYKDDTSSDRLDTIVQVSSIINGEHIASISRDGVVYTWGYNNRFQLGDKSQETSVVPVVAGNAKMSIMPPTATLAVDGKTTITITGADMFSVYTDLASSVGTFEWKVLDDSIAKVTVDSQQPKTANVIGVTEGETRVVATNTITQQTVFSRIIVTEDITYAQIQLGKDFTVALKKDGTLWAWGNNENGMTGTGSKQSMLTIPVQIDSYYASVNDAAQEIATPMENILSVAVGENHAIIIGQSGKVYAWGDNTYGQLGVNPILIKNTNRPILVELDENFASQIIDVSAGAYHTVAVTATGEVYTWGRNNKGQLGRKTVTEDNDPTNFVPEKMKGVGESNLSGVVMSAASKEATAVLIANGTVYTVGGNSHGELGTGISKSVEYNTQLEKVTTIRKEDEASENQEELNNVTRIVGKGYNFVAISTKYHYTGNTNPDGTPEYVYDRNRRVYMG